LRTCLDRKKGRGPFLFSGSKSASPKEGALFCSLGVSPSTLVLFVSRRKSSACFVCAGSLSNALLGVRRLPLPRFACCPGVVRPLDCPLCAFPLCAFKARYVALECPLCAFKACSRSAEVPCDLQGAGVGSAGQAAPTHM